MVHYASPTVNLHKSENLAIPPNGGRLYILIGLFLARFIGLSRRALGQSFEDLSFEDW